MDKYLYFSEGGGANATTELYVAKASNITGIVPTGTTTTELFIRKKVGVDNKEVMDKITFTHDNTTNTTGHRVKDISKAVAQAANAGPHVAGMTDVVDMDNNIFLNNLSFITGTVVTLNLET